MKKKQGWVLYNKKQRKICDGPYYFAGTPEGYGSLQDWFFKIAGPHTPEGYYRLCAVEREKWQVKARERFGKTYCIRRAKVTTLPETLEF